jgi:hypothetical protein
MEFTPMPKIARWSREVIITEKIDGTNASIYIAKEEPVGSIERILSDNPPFDKRIAVAHIGQPDTGFTGHIWAGSRTRWITPGKEDNYGFAAWVKANADELIKLGPGFHFGEWWGAGIQRAYGMKNGEKHFSLFDTRWHEREHKPNCASVVPVIFKGGVDGIPTQGWSAVTIAMRYLQEAGSLAAPGFMRPEGIVIWHSTARIFLKKTFEKDEEGKNESKSPNYYRQKENENQ